jgi:hypothetical protein
MFHSFMGLTGETSAHQAARDKSGSSYGRARSNTVGFAQVDSSEDNIHQMLRDKSRVSTFNNKLLTTGRPSLGEGSSHADHFDLKDYMYAFQNYFFPGDDYMKIYSFVSHCGSGDFCMREENLPMVTCLSSKHLEKYDIMEGADYKVVSKHSKHSPWYRRYQKTKVFTPVAFKKVLLLSGDSRFVNYYIFLDQVIDAYTEYQLAYARLEQKKKTDIINTLNSKLMEKEMEIMRLRRISELHDSDHAADTAEDQCAWSEHRDNIYGHPSIFVCQVHSCCPGYTDSCQTIPESPGAIAEGRPRSGRESVYSVDEYSSDGSLYRESNTSNISTSVSVFDTVQH